ncbi:transforming growth factor beta receptor type 3-like isoform X2 [Liolophura sinensis]|uniref:transforming growth factor beta receptor type 3-like isoform X2 n=1 Tax=Liolophura sinensis TaxID=3198878 RepID=UPI003158A66D
MHGCSWVLGLLLALNMDLLLRWKTWGAAVEPKDCVIASPYESRYVRAYLEHSISERRSCASNSTTTAGQEVHVVNLVELSQSSIPTPFEVSVTVKPHQNRGKYRKPLVIVLKSDIPTTWRVETIKIRDASPIRHLFVISKQSTILFHNFSLRQSVLKVDGMPDDSESLIAWVERMYGQLTSFSELSGVNALVMEVGMHTASFIKGAYREDRHLTGCANVDNANKNSKSVHIIEVSGGDLGGTASEIVVEIVPEILGSVKSELVLLLKSPPNLSWKVKSRKVRGNIEIVGNSYMDTEEVNMDTVETRIEKLPYSGKDLVSWVEYRYGPILSYSGVPTSNHILLLVPERDEPRDEKSNSDYPPYLSKPDAPKLSPFKNPSRTEMAVRRSMSVECQRNGLMIFVPKKVASTYGILEDYLSLRNPACRAHANASHFILSSTLYGCNTQVAHHKTQMSFTNALVIKSITYADSRRDDSILVGSGDGNLDDREEDFSGSGYGGLEGDNSAAAMTHMDDEDYHVQTLEIEITCHRDKHGQNSNNRFFLDVFSGPRYDSLAEDPILARPGESIYAQASVVAEPGIHLQVLECGLQSQSIPGISLLNIIRQGCIEDGSTKWLTTSSGNDVLTSASTVRFTFRIPDHMTVVGHVGFDVVCRVLPCSQSAANSKLPQCMDQDQFCANQLSTSPQHLPKAIISQVTTGRITLQRDNTGLLGMYPVDTHPPRFPFPEPKDLTTLKMTNSEQSNKDTPQGKIIMEGLDSGTVIGIAFAAFVIGVMLTAALWYIHAHTGPVKQTGPSRGWAESSGETTPCSTAPIHIST